MWIVVTDYPCRIVTQDGGAFGHFCGVRGKRAAATRRPSSARRLYVEHAFRCGAFRKKENDVCMRDARLTVFIISTWMPALLRYCRRAGGIISTFRPVPTKRISGVSGQTQVLQRAQ